MILIDDLTSEELSNMAEKMNDEEFMEFFDDNNLKYLKKLNEKQKRRFKDLNIKSFEQAIDNLIKIATENKIGNLPEEF